MYPFIYSSAGGSWGCFSTFGLLSKMLQRAFMYKYLFKSLLSILEYILEENVDGQHFTSTVHSSPVGNVPKLGTAQIPNNGRRDKQFRCICMQQCRENDRVSAAVWTNLTQNTVGVTQSSNEAKWTCAVRSQDGDRSSLWATRGAAAVWRALVIRSWLLEPQCSVRSRQAKHSGLVLGFVCRLGCYKLRKQCTNSLVQQF